MGVMAGMILVDYDTVLKFPEVTKRSVIEHIVAHPEYLITVLNPNHGMTLKETQAKLKSLKFPVDKVIITPLGVLPPITYKTIFANTFIDNPEHKIVAVIDTDPEALQMWQSLGVQT